MAVKRVRAIANRELIDPAAGPSRRRGDRAVAWLIVSFACFALIVLTFATARSRKSKLPEMTLTSPPVAQSDRGFRVIRVLDGDTIVIIGQDNIELTLR